MTEGGPMGIDVRRERRRAASPAPGAPVAEPAGPARRRSTPGPVIWLLVFGAYLLSAQYTFLLNDPSDSGAALWPAAGVTLGALLVLPRRRWGWVLSAVAAAEFGGDVSQGLPVLASLGWALANCVEPLVGALLLRRVTGDAAPLTPVRNLLWFLALAVGVGPLAGSLIGTTTTVLALDGWSWSEVWTRYVLGDALGVLVVAPVVLTARGLRSVRPSAEGVLLAVSALTTVVVVFASPGDRWQSHAAFVLVPFFVWAGLRFGIRGSAWLALPVTLVTNALTSTGRGPFGGDELLARHAETMLQLFLAVTIGSALVVAALVSELTDRHELEAVLRRRAASDTLTGLPNRLALGAELHRALHAGVGDPGRVALLACDIDHLKLVNDTMGHAAGDRMILEVAHRIQDAIRDDDVVARIGGDEFVVVLADVDEATALRLAERIVKGVGEPVLLGAHQRASPSLSVGLAMGGPGVTGEAVFNAADAALYAAKSRGRGQTVAFDQRLRRATLERLELERDVPGAIGAGQVTAVHQPQLELATGALFGLETLARWCHPERGAVTADQLVLAAERTGEAGALFGSMLRQTLAAQATWVAALGVHLPVAVNLSPLQLRDPGLARSVADALAEAGAPPDALWLELTESALAEPAALATLDELHGLGVRLALDDFGTGWSSMSRLAQLPCDVLKLDKSFVAALGVEESADHLVRAMIVMAHALEIRTVAEGVETQSQLERLTDLGCDVVQGYLVSRPVPADEVPHLVTPTGLWRGAGARA